MAKGADLYGTGLLDETLAPEKGGKLGERFMIPPFSVLNAREGWWQERKRAWLALGIQSELGRGESVPTEFVAPAGADRDMAPQPGPQTSSSVVTAATAPRAAKKHTVVVEKPPTNRGDKSAPIVGGVSFTMPPSTWMPPQELPSLAGVKRLCVDVETRDEFLTERGSGVRTGAYVAGLGVGTDDGRRWYLPVRHEGGGNLDEGLVKRWAREEFGSFAGELVGAKLIYDLDFLAHPNWGVDFKNVKAYHDVLILEPLLDEWRFSYNLDSVGQTHLGESKREELLKEAIRAMGYGDEVKENLWRLPAAYVGPYAEGDVDLPLRILPLQLKKIEEEGLQTVYEVERKLIPCLLAMKQRGVQVNTDRAEEVRGELVTRRDELLGRLKHLAGRQAEFMAPQSMEGALQDRGLDLQYTPKTREISITKEWLERNESDELCAIVLAGRKVNTTITTFMDGHILGHAVNGRIHCDFNQLKGEMGGTIARLSSSNPNLQNVPARDEEMSTLVRGMFEPDGDDEWERQDQSQVEYKLLAHYAVGDGAEECRRKYREEPATDYHKFCAEMCGIDPEDKIKRKRVKNINFAKGYGAGAERLAGQMKCSLAEAEEFIELYERNLPFTKATYDAAAKWGKNRGFVTSILGRRQRFPLWEPMGYGNKGKPLRHAEALKEYGPRIQRSKTYTALNRKLQSSGADIMKKTMVDCYESGLIGVLGAPLLTVHDELDWSVPRTAAGREAADEAKHLGEVCVTLKVPLRVDCERGTNWGNCK